MCDRRRLIRADLYLPKHFVQLMEKPHQHFFFCGVNFFLSKLCGLKTGDHMALLAIFVWIPWKHPYLTKETVSHIDQLQALSPEARCEPTNELQCSSHLNCLDSRFLGFWKIRDEVYVPFFKNCQRNRYDHVFSGEDLAELVLQGDLLFASTVIFITRWRIWKRNNRIWKEPREKKRKKKWVCY